MPGDTTEPKPMLERARASLSLLRGTEPRDRWQKADRAAQAQAEATLAVAEELRALREMFGLTGRAGTVGDQVVFAVENVQGAITDAAQTVAAQAMKGGSRG